MKKRTKKETSYYKLIIKDLLKFFYKLLKTRIKENYKHYRKKLSLLYSILDKSVKKNIFHKNTIARKKSKITKSLNNINLL